MAARDRTITAKAASLMPPPEPGSFYRRNLHTYYDSKFSAAFRENRYEKPSEFFLTEMPWIFGLVVYTGYKDAFLYMVDHVTDYPYSISWARRSYRSKKYLPYMNRIGRILHHFADACCIDADLKDILTGNLPEDARAYLKHRNLWSTPYVAAALAYELDQDDPQLESIVTDIMNGDNGFTVVSRSFIEGIVMSHNKRMHELLCKLLLAAKLQEGLRQAICEEADWGTKEDFHALPRSVMQAIRSSLRRLQLA